MKFDIEVYDGSALARDAQMYGMDTFDTTTECFEHDMAEVVKGFVAAAMKCRPKQVVLVLRPHKEKK